VKIFCDNDLAGPLRGALIGFGFIGEKGHFPAFRARETAGTFAITCIAESSPARREMARRLAPGIPLYEDVSSLLAAQADQLDFVVIATPPCDHAPIAHAALQRGLHVLCEKPLATSAREAQSMLDHAQQVKRVIFPSHNYKHAPVVRAVRDVIASGRIGQVHLVTLDTFRTTHARGVPEWLPDWRRVRRYSGGGIAMDHGSHTFYLAFEWLRSYPIAITAKMSHLAAFDTEDNFSCTLTFPTGIATAQLTWNAGMRKVVYTLHGDRGAVKIEDDDVQITVKGEGISAPEVERLSVESHWMDASHVTWFHSLHDQFAQAIRDREYVGREAREAYLCVQLIETAYQSARSSCKELALASDVPGLASASGV
jgi:predicted dehydrogenase